MSENSYRNEASKKLWVQLTLATVQRHDHQKVDILKTQHKGDNSTIVNSYYLGHDTWVCDQHFTGTSSSRSSKTGSVKVDGHKNPLRDKQYRSSASAIVRQNQIFGFHNAMHTFTFN